jgi:large subunit ribosomal protein L24
VIAGKDKGFTGEVVRILNKDNRVIVNNINIMKKHEKARQVGNQQIPAQISEFEAPLDLSNVMLVCPSAVKQPAWATTSRTMATKLVSASNVIKT